MRNAGLTVVKIGGSHAGAAHLERWLDKLATCGGRVVVVPGGGLFADAVRVAQAQMGFDDNAAHEMALLAMEQFGLVLTQHRTFRVASSLDGIRRLARAGKVPVWAPSRMVLRAKDIPASWDITSDSLASWLAGRLGAKRLLLVKHGGFARAVPASALAARGVVDAAFARFLAQSGAQAFIASPDAHDVAAAAIRAGETPGTPIVLHDEGASGLQALSWPRSRRRVGAGP